MKVIPPPPVAPSRGLRLVDLLHDAHIAALCIEHGISDLITGDRDFTRFPLRITNPFG